MTRVGPLCLGAVLTLAGCAPTLKLSELPLQGGRYEVIERELLQRAAAGSGEAQRDLGWLQLLYRGETSEALARFEAALGARSDDPLALLGRAAVLHDQGRYAPAAAAWLALAQRAPLGDAQGQQLQALALQKLAALGRPEAVLSPEALGELVKLRPGALARDQHLALLAGLARRRGQPERLAHYERQRGCPARLALVGPEHHLPHLDLGRPLAAAGGRVVPTEGCTVRLDGPRPGGGIYQLESEVQSTQATPALLSVRSRQPWLLRVDGQEIYRHQPLAQRAPALVRLKLRWPAGRHRLALQVGAAGASKVRLTLASLDPQLTLRFADPPAQGWPEQAAEASSPPARVRTLRPRAWPDAASSIPLPEGLPLWYAPLTSYLAAQQATLTGDLDQGYRQLARVEQLAPRLVMAQLLAASLLLDDPLLPRKLAVERALARYDAVLAQDRELGRAAYNQALLTLEQEQPERALALFVAGKARWPGEHRWWLGLQQVYRWFSYRHEEQQALQAALAQNPRLCQALEDLAALQRSRKAVTEAGQLVQRAHACDASSAVLARQLLDSGQLAAAADELRRLIRLRPANGHLRRTLVEVLRRSGQHQEADERLARLMAEHPGAAEYSLLAADGQLGRGLRQAGLRTLEAAQARAPWRRRLRRALEQLRGERTLEQLRRDGQDVVAAYQKNAQRVEAPAVMVQDRAVTRLWPDGASLTLTHNIIQVLSKEGIEQWGEARLPGGAEPLMVRVIKADGSTREAEEIAGKGSLSLPDLDRGDFVELEYLEAKPPAKGGVGFVAPRFYFRSFTAPMVLSEYLVLAPPELPLVWQRRGGAPEPAERQQAGLRLLHFAARRQPRAVSEPAAAPPEEYLPSVILAAGSSWQRWQAYFHQESIAALQGSYQLQQLATAVTAAEGSPRAKALALYREVLERVEQQGATLQSAGRSLVRGSGSRHSTLVALLRLAGLEAELVLARPLTEAQLEERIPDISSYKVPLVRCRLPEGELYLEPSDPVVPFGYLSPELRGAQALRLAAEGTARLRLPLEQPGARDSRRFSVQVKLPARGPAQLQVREELEGFGAQQWRLLQRKLDPPRLRKVFEQAALGLFFSGASLQQLQLEGVSQPERPLVLRYAFNAPDLVQHERGGRQVRLSIFPPLLGRRYGRLSRRQTPLLVDYHSPLEMALSLSPPAGTRFAAAPADLALAGEFGHFRREAQLQPDGSLRLHLSVAVRFGRIPPERYPAFLSFARAVDDAYQESVALLPAGPEAQGKKPAAAAPASSGSASKPQRRRLR